MAAFARTASTTLTRQSARGPLVYVEPGSGEAQATVMEQHLASGGQGLLDAVLTGDSLHHLNERHTVVEEDGGPVFYVERYRAAAGESYAVFAPDGAPLAEYLSGDVVELRDGTGAPVGFLRRAKDRLEIVERGASVIGQCWRQPVDLDWMVDDAWGLTVLEEPSVLDRRGLVAAPLVCRLWWSGPPRRQDEQTGLLRRAFLS